MVDLLLESALRSLLLGVWLCIALLRTRNPRTEMTAWIFMLAVGLAMPALMGRVTVTLPAAAPMLHAVEQPSAISGPLSVPLAEFAEVPAPPVTSAAVDIGRVGWLGFDWRTLAAATYLAAGGWMLLRLITGVLLSFRIARAARPLREDWTRGADVRVSDVVARPATFGCTVLLPATYIGWSEAKRRAVLSHELSHVAHGDFFVLLLASLHRAVFCFSPLAWWQFARMAELAEIISDDAALEMVDDRRFYASILVDLAGGHPESPVAKREVFPAAPPWAMVRVATLRMRIGRILEGAAMPTRIGWRKRTAVVLVLAPAAIAAAGAVGPGVARPPDASVPAASVPSDRVGGATGTGQHPLDSYYGGYLRRDAGNKNCSSICDGSSTA